MCEDRIRPKKKVVPKGKVFHSIYSVVGHGEGRKSAYVCVCVWGGVLWKSPIIPTLLYGLTSVEPLIHFLDHTEHSGVIWKFQEFYRNVSWVICVKRKKGVGREHIPGEFQCWWLSWRIRCFPASPAAAHQSGGWHLSNLLSMLLYEPLTDVWIGKLSCYTCIFDRPEKKPHF